MSLDGGCSSILGDCLTHFDQIMVLEMAHPVFENDGDQTVLDRKDLADLRCLSLSGFPREPCLNEMNRMSWAIDSATIDSWNFYRL